MALEVLKWIGLVLAAGFIGYIGRYLAGQIIDRIHKKRAERAETAEINGNPRLSLAEELEEHRIKQEKKKAKQEFKKAKKAAKT